MFPPSTDYLADEKNGRSLIEVVYFEALFSSLAVLFRCGAS